MTIDLNGSVLSGNGARYVAVRGGKLTVEDSSGTGKITNNQAAIRVISDGELIVNSGTIESTASSAITVGQQTAQGGTVTINGGNVKAQEVAVLAIYPGAKVTINGGELQTVDNFVVGGNGSAGQGDTDITINGGILNGNITSSGYIACGIYHPQKGNLTIHGGIINANGGVGILMRGGELNMDGGTINATGASTLEGKVGDSTVAVGTSGIAIDKKAKYYDADNILINLSGNAKVLGAKTAIEEILNADQTLDGQIEIIGGTYSSDVTQYVADGYVVTKDADGT